MFGDVQAMLSRRSVEFDEPTRGSLQNAWPYFAGFIPYPYRYDSSATGTALTAAQVEADGPDGILLPAGAAPVDFYVPLPRNAAFQLESIRYSAHYIRQEEDTEIYGARDMLLGTQDLYANAGESSQYTDKGFQSRSYSEMIDISVWLGSAGDRDYYGAEAWNPATGDVQDVPVPLSALQQKGDGPGTVTLRALLAGNTVIRFRARNNFSRALRLNGVVFGYQVQA